jgi:hypothetical protein
MTPKEKANELVNKMKFATDEFGYININVNRHKQCALIAVDEIINQLTSIEKAPNNLMAFEYWNEVKQEINNL